MSYPTSPYANYVGRPSPIFYARRLSARQGDARIFLKREDLNHTGAHKTNHCLSEALRAKHMGKTKVLAETGAGLSLCLGRHRLRNPHERDRHRQGTP